MLVIRPRYVKRGGNINPLLVPLVQKGLDLLTTGAKRKLEEVAIEGNKKGYIDISPRKIREIVNGRGIIKC